MTNIAWILPWITICGCGSPAMSGDAATDQKIVLTDTEITSESLTEAKKELKKTRKDVKCIKMYLRDQTAQQAGRIPEDWEQPMIQEYEDKGCTSLAPKKVRRRE